MSTNTLTYLSLHVARLVYRKSVDGEQFTAEVTWCVEPIAHAQQGRRRLGTRVLYSLAAYLQTAVSK